MDVEKLLPNIKNYIKKDMDVIYPNEKSSKGLSVPGLSVEYGSVSAKIKDLPFVGTKLVKCISECKKSYRALSDQPTKPKKVISQDDMSDLKEYAKSIGVDKIGFAKVDPSLIFNDKVILFDNAIVFMMEMKADIINTVPSTKAVGEIFRTYLGLGVGVNKICDFLKAKGYEAEAGPAIGGEVNYPLLAEKAGMGVVGKHGLLISPEFGPSLRLAAVYTNIENLPMSEENPYQWIKEFCKKCKKCVRKCPVGAIYEQTQVIDGQRKEIDYRKCAMPFTNDHGCTVCVKECAFFNGGYEKLKKNNKNPIN